MPWSKIGGVFTASEQGKVVGGRGITDHCRRGFVRGPGTWRDTGGAAEPIYVSLLGSRKAAREWGLRRIWG